MKKPTSSRALDTVSICTALGTIRLGLYADRAPLTVSYFMDLITRRLLDHTSFYRIVSEQNQGPDIKERITVIQGGHVPPSDGVFDILEHEATSRTGLKHTAFSLSMPRFKIGQVYKSFFITLRDEPCLDHGGKRHEDGQGFAVFGTVIDGFDVVEAIYGKAEASDFIANPIRITGINPDKI